MPFRDVTITSHFLDLNKAGGITTITSPDGNETQYSYMLNNNDPKNSSIRQDNNSRSPYVVDSLAENVRLVHSKSHHNVMYALGRWAGKKHKRPVQEFCTGSRYAGEWNELGSFSGEGIYRYPHGVIYEGEFNKKGEFHGIGTLIYPGGQKVQAMWKNGRLMDGAGYVFPTGEIQDEYHKYCQPPDRRYHLEISQDFGPVGHEYLTNEPTPKYLPSGCYDVAYGIYDPRKLCIYAPIKSERTLSYQAKDLKIMNEDKYKDMIAILNYKSKSQDVLAEKADFSEFELKGERIVEIPTKSTSRWIEKNCRKAWDEPCGYQRHLYKYWLGGRRWELDKCETESLEMSYYDVNTDDETDDVADVVSQQPRTHPQVTFVHTVSGKRQHRRTLKSIPHSRKSSAAAKRRTLVDGMKLSETDR